MTTTVSNLQIAPARPEDAELIAGLVRELAEFVRLLDQVNIDADDLRRDLFGANPYAEAAIAWVGEEAVGFALWNQPAIDFYRKLGAVPMESWTVYRVSGADLERLAAP